MNFSIKTTLASCLMLLFSFGLFAQDVVVGNTTLTKREVAVGLQIPWEILWGPDDYIWATERRGRVLRIEPVSGNIETVLNIEDDVDSGSEPGMLGMVFHPDWPVNASVFIVHNYLIGGFNREEKLIQLTWNGTELVNPVTILDGINGAGIHNGSRLLISEDRKIIMTTGDTANSSLPQDMESLNGKTLRINLDGSVPDDNPVEGSYVYSFGHRNSQGLCYGPTGILYSSEHGAQSSDEFNIIEPNRNYGWPDVEGACNTSFEMNYCNANNVREPLKEWSPCIAVNGIEYYDHPAIPEFNNSVLMCVLGGLGGGAERVSQLQLSEDGLEVTAENQYFDNFGRLRDLCINPYTGAILIATNGPSYPGSGPNKIIEYSNLEYLASSNSTTQLEDQFIKVSPNPIDVQGIVEFSPNFVGQQYEIISYAGQVIATGLIDQSTIELNKGQLPAGAYYIKASNERGMITKSFVVQ